MGSFKLKLVGWFAVLAFLPLAVAFFGYGNLAKRSEERRADAGLEAGLRAAVAGYSGRLESASTTAQHLASVPEIQTALRMHDRGRLTAIAAAHPGVVLGAGDVTAGAAPPGAAARSVAVVDRGRRLGRITVSVPVDDRLLASLSSGLGGRDRLVATRFGRVLAGAPRGASLSLQPGQAAKRRLAGESYRGLATAALLDPPGLELVALTPQHAIDSAARTSEVRIGTTLFGSILLFAVVAYLLGRSVVSTVSRLAEAANSIAEGRLGVRVDVRGRDEFARLGGAFNRMASELEQRLAELEAERLRGRAATARFGEALAATHDSRQLMKVIAESAVEAVGATGGVVIGREGELARAGDPEAGTERVAFPLRVGSSDFGSLVISSPTFDADQIQRAVSLTAQAVIALENARLHGIVERQAFVDPLTGLANRRSLEETLRAELARGARYDSEVCLVLADLDLFKQVNDRYGHPTGDEVLREFAQALRETLRESDVAGRWGGEEFALILTGTDADGGARLAERARETFEARTIHSPGGDPISVTASFGVAAFPDCPEIGELIASADSALYAAKREGRNRVVVANSVNP